MTDTTKTTMNLYEAIKWMFEHPNEKLEYQHGEAWFDGIRIVRQNKHEPNYNFLILEDCWLKDTFTIPKSKLEELKEQQDKELLKLRQSLTCDSCDISSESIYNLGLKHQQERDALEREKQ